ncbi:MAG: ATP-grasp domain-containing protein [Lachnospiraceae bacterium]|nr:ATP-grasp domain-containing protein [Lachnospiraceae bacterium]
MDGVDASGNILVRDLRDISFLFCNHPLYQRKADEDYEAEYQAAGLNHACALFSYEDLEKGRLSLYGESISGLAIYRGWMMKPEMYERFYSLLEEKGIVLINTPDEYRTYHLLPEWYSDFEEETAKSVWEEQGSLENALEMAKALEGAYIVKDYVKSRKHEWYDACFIKNIADKENTSKVIGNFIERQGASLVGGIVLRKFEHLMQIGFHEKSGMPLSEEYRVFICAGRILNIEDYWTEKADVKITDEEKHWLEEIAHKVKSNFVTVDIARKTDGSLVIMEFGDGQVSGLQQMDAMDFYEAFDVK